MCREEWLGLAIGRRPWRTWVDMGASRGICGVGSGQEAVFDMGA